jgi:hypothetical protein
MGEEQWPPETPERRREPRRPCAAGADLLLVLPGPEFLWGPRVNACAGGLGLLVSRPVPLGVTASVLNARAPPGVRLVLRVRVVHVAARADDGWLVGCEFMEALTDEEVRALGG